MKLDSALSIAAPARAGTSKQPLSFFEFWPDWLFYFPVVVHWLALGVRYGSFTLPTAANPTITAGGLCGESKQEILDLVRSPARELVARFTSVVAGSADADAAERAMMAAEIFYPVVAKPDVGCN